MGVDRYNERLNTKTEGSKRSPVPIVPMTLVFRRKEKTKVKKGPIVYGKKKINLYTILDPPYP